ncbi:MAG: response regulator [Pseudomonadales bacterium]|nr:response regulator [Pseudomonadales bacterium]
MAENLTTFARTGLLLFGLLPCLAAGWLYHFVTTSLLQPLSKSLALLQKALVQKDLLRNDLLQKDAATQIPALPHRGINRLADCLSLPRLLDTCLRHKDQLADAREARARQAAEAAAETRNKACEEEISALHQARTEAVTALASQQDNSSTLEHNQRLLLSMADTSLNTIVSCTNLLASPGAATAVLLARLNAAAKRLLFYQAELRALTTDLRDEAEPSSAEFVLRDCIDQVIMLLHPTLAQQNCELLPVYDDSCQVNLVGQQTRLQAMLFNYLLAVINSSLNNHSLDNHSLDNQGLIKQGLSKRKIAAKFAPSASSSFLWHISLASNSQNTPQPDRLILRLGQGLSMPAAPLTARLDRLLDMCDGIQESQQLSLPVNCSHTPVHTCPTGLTARIFAQNPVQEAGLHNRLSQLGINVQTHGTDVSLCFIGAQAHSDIVNIAGAFSPKTHILLLNNNRLYGRSDWLALPRPLQQTEFINLMTTTFPMGADQRLNVLIVDDDHHARLFLAALLRQAGYNVIEAADGLAALDIIATHAVDLVFMDIHMPRMNGLEATRELRASLSRQLPVIALTAHLMDTERDAVLAAGINDILIKPLDVDTLSRCLTTWLGGAPGSANNGDGAAKEPTPRAVFDVNLALKIANQQPDLALEMLELFVQAIPFEQQQITQAVTANKPELLHRLIHKLNGASRYCGIPRVQAVLGELETLLKTGAEGQALAIQRVHNELTLLHAWYGQNPEPLAAMPRTQLRRLPPGD